jgi:magnesium chelatase accessory protein
MPSASWPADAVVSRAVSARRPPNDWPLRAYSQHTQCGPHHWHWQQLGQGPDLLLLHGTAASTHSFHRIALALAKQFRVTLVDLPGHGYTLSSAATPLSLTAVAGDLAVWLNHIGLAPQWLIGHSAGAAVAVELALSQGVKPAGLIGLNAALLPLPGMAGQLFSPMAKLCANRSWLASWVARHAKQPGSIERLLRGTGSQLSTEDIACYRQLLSDPHHVAGVIRLMAEWDLHDLQRRLPALKTPTVLWATGRDKTIPRSQIQRAASISRVIEWADIAPLGHLAHEESPELIARHIREHCQ